MSLLSRSFLHRVNDRVREDSRPILKRCNTRQQEAFFNMVNIYVFDIGSICIHGKESLRNFTFHPKIQGTDLTIKQMFDISEKLIVGQSDEIYEGNPINCEDSLWKQLSWVGDEEVISLSHAKVYVFSDSVLWPLKDEPEPTIKYCLGRQVDVVQEFTVIQKLGQNWRWANEIRVEYFPRIHHIAVQQQSPRVHVKKSEKPEEFTGRIIFMSMFNGISWGSQDSEQECELKRQLRFYLCEKIVTRKMVIPRTWVIKQVVFKIGTDAGFLTTVDVGQYFMTKDTEEFSQFTESVASREYTLPRDEKSSGPKGGEELESRPHKSVVFKAMLGKKTNGSGLARCPNLLDKGKWWTTPKRKRSNWTQRNDCAAGKENRDDSWRQEVDTEESSEGKSEFTMYFYGALHKQADAMDLQQEEVWEGMQEWEGSGQVGKTSFHLRRKGEGRAAADDAHRWWLQR